MNKEQLNEAILAIKPDATIEGLTNDQLSELLESLQPPPVPAANPDVPEPHPDGAAADALRARTDAAAKRADDAAANKSEYEVAPGKGITSLRGILSDGEPVAATDLQDGEVTLEYLIDLGCIVKN